MKRHRFWVCVLLPAWLCAACMPEAPAPEPAAVVLPAAPLPLALAVPTLPTPDAPAKPAGFSGWWDYPEVLARLGLSAGEGEAMASELARLERVYQTAQRQLRTVRDTQSRMLADARVPSADVRRFNQRNLQMLLTSMLDQDIAARLWVREHLSAEQRARVLANAPQFYAMRWFRAAPAPEEPSTRAPTPSASLAPPGAGPQ